MQPEDAVAAFAEQAIALKEGGVDVLWIETMSSREEIELAVRGAGEAGLPIVFTVSFDTNGRTMMGLGASDLVNLYKTTSPKAHACGTNCGIGAAEVVASVISMKSAADAGPDPVLVAKANCGIPEYVDGKIVYNGTPEVMARFAVMARDAGARIIGGCCGTTATHVAAMREALDTTAPASTPSLEDINAALGEITAGARAQASGETEAPVRAVARGRRRRRA